MGIRATGDKKYQTTHNPMLDHTQVLRLPTDKILLVPTPNQHNRLHFVSPQRPEPLREDLPRLLLPPMATTTSHATQEKMFPLPSLHPVRSSSGDACALHAMWRLRDKLNTHPSRHDKPNVLPYASRPWHLITPVARTHHSLNSSATPIHHIPSPALSPPGSTTKISGLGSAME